MKAQETGNAQANNLSRSFWLDVLRVLLCTGVVIYHYTPERPSSGPMCVDGFFVMSGFLLAAGFERMRSMGGMDVCAFYSSKARRLLPTLLAGLLLGLLFLVARNKPLLPEWTGSDFRLATFVEHYDVPAWYMMSELAFLGLAPFLFFLYGMGKKAVIPVFLVTALFAAMLYNNVPFAQPFGGGLYFQPQARLWQFMGGIVSWLLFSKVQLRPWMKACTWVLFGCTVALLAALAVIKQYTTLHALNYTYWFDLSMVLLFMVLVPALTKLGAPRRGGLCKAMAYAAALTYPVYLYHVPVWNFVFVGTGKVMGYAVNVGIFGGVAALSTILLSAISLKYLDGFFAKKKRPTPAP